MPSTPFVDLFFAVSGPCFITEGLYACGVAEHCGITIGGTRKIAAIQKTRFQNSGPDYMTTTISHRSIRGGSSTPGEGREVHVADLQARAFFDPGSEAGN